MTTCSASLSNENTARSVAETLLQYDRKLTAGELQQLQEALNRLTPAQVQSLLEGRANFSAVKQLADIEDKLARQIFWAFAIALVLSLVSAIYSTVA